MSFEQPTLPISAIKENPDALRTVDKEREEFVELMGSIQQHGIQSPILVRPAADDPEKFVLIDGAHRYTCAKELGLSSIPVRIMDATDMDVYERQMVANLHVVKTRPAEYARQLKRMLVRNPLLTVPELCKTLSKSTTWLHGMLRITELETEFQDLVDKGTINVFNAQALASLPKEEQRDWADRAATMTSADFKQAVDSRLKEIKKAKAEGKDPNAPQEFIPTARVRKLVDLKQVYDAPSLLSSIIGTETDPIAVGHRIIAWVISLDEKTVEEKKAAEAARKDELKAKREASEVERLEKKKKDVEEAIAKAKAKSEAAAS